MTLCKRLVLKKANVKDINMGDAENCTSSSTNKNNSTTIDGTPNINVSIPCSKTCEDSVNKVNVRYFCKHPGCTSSYSKRTKLNEHELTHTIAQRPFKCNIEGCTKAYKSSCHLKRHIRTCHVKVEPTEMLEISWNTQNVSVQRERPKRKEHVCRFPDCKKVFSKMNRLIQHERSHATIPEKPFGCHFENCVKAYASRCHLIRHIKSYHLKQQRTRSFQCTHENCIMRFPDKFSLKRHMKTHAIKVYTCHECEIKFHKYSKLAAHLAEHRGEYKFQCEHCEMKYRSISALQRHSWKHRTYKCKEPGCEQVFQKWFACRRHMKIEHPSVFTCHFCGNDFKRKVQLERHITLHHIPVVDFWPCPYKDCYRSYFYKSNLSHHIRTYHLNLKYVCDIPGCTKTFIQRRRLLNHQRDHIVQASSLKFKPKTIKEGRRRRWDRGLPKRSSAAYLSGIKLANHIQHRITLNLLQSEDERVIAEKITQISQTTFNGTNEPVEITPDN